MLCRSVSKITTPRGLVAKPSRWKAKRERVALTSPTAKWPRLALLPNRRRACRFVHVVVAVFFCVLSDHGYTVAELAEETCLHHFTCRCPDCVRHDPNGRLMAPSLWYAHKQRQQRPSPEVCSPIVSEGDA